jgi:hypothetical protein
MDSFKLLTDFITELNLSYGHTQKPLVLFHRLLTRKGNMSPSARQTLLNHTKDFCIANRDAITRMDVTAFQEKCLKMDEKYIFVDFGKLVEDAGGALPTEVWRYLLSLSALLDPESTAKEVLTRQPLPSPSAVSQMPHVPAAAVDMLGDLVRTIQTDLESFDLPATDNPIETATSLVKSGALGKIVETLQTKMQNGEIDLTAMMGMAQQMVGEMAAGAGGGDPMMASMLMGMMANAGHM